MQDFGPTMGRQTPEAPRDPRLDILDANGFHVYGTANTFLPMPGMPHIPAVVYGPDQGDGLGKALDDPKQLENMQQYAHQEYMHSLTRQEKEADNDVTRAQIAAQREQTQRNWETSRADREERVRTARDGQAAARGLQEQRIAAEALQHAQTLVGPANFKIPQGSAPGGITVDEIGGWAYARGADGQITATYPIPRPAPEAKEVTGFGIQQQTIDPVTHQLTYTPTGQYPQRIVNNRVISDSPTGLVQTSRLSEDPQVTRWTDEWGREKSMNTRTGERRTYTEGHPIIQQRGDRTWVVPPPREPTYVPPQFTPTTYGAPETPWAGQQGVPMLPGVTRLPNGMIRVPDEYFGQPSQQSPQTAQYQAQPQFVQPSQVQPSQPYRNPEIPESELGPEPDLAEVY